MTAADVLAGDAAAARIYEALLARLRETGPVEEDATKTQIAWRAPGGRRFAAFWLPYRALGHGPHDPAVTIDLPERDPSPRVKEATQAAPRHWSHHAMVPSVDAVDAELMRLLGKARRLAEGAPAPRKERKP